MDIKLKIVLILLVSIVNLLIKTTVVYILFNSFSKGMAISYTK